MNRLLRVLAATVIALGLAAAGSAGAAKRHATPEKAPDAAPAPAKPAPAKPAPSKPVPGKTADDDTSGEIKRGDRIEFDERLIQGQTAKAGALYLFDRKPSDLRSMVHERSSYRDEIVHEIFPDQEGVP